MIEACNIKPQAQKVVTKSEKEARNEHTLQYNERNPFDIDCAVFLPIYRGSPIVKCAYCSSAYSLGLKGKLCETCSMSLVVRSIIEFLVVRSVA
jgi:coatomer protein complex subunit alpha (xenin)